MHPLPGARRRELGWEGAACLREAPATRSEEKGQNVKHKPKPLHEALIALGASCVTVSEEQIDDPSFVHPDGWVNIAIKHWREEKLKARNLNERSLSA